MTKILVWQQNNNDKVVNFLNRGPWGENVFVRRAKAFIEWCCLRGRSQQGRLGMRRTFDTTVKIAMVLRLMLKDWNNLPEGQGCWSAPAPGCPRPPPGCRPPASMPPACPTFWQQLIWSLIQMYFSKNWKSISPKELQYFFFLPTNYTLWEEWLNLFEYIPANIELLLFLPNFPPH